MSVTLTLIAAVAANGVIGRADALPWRLRTDLRRFKALTMGKPVIMGRRTWQSIGRPLPGREIVVMTGQAAWAAPGVAVARGWEEAKAAAADLCRQMGADEAVVVGGAAVYEAALPEVERLHLTRVHASPVGDVFFPPFDQSLFRTTLSEAHPAGPEDEHAFTFVDLERLPLSTPAAGSNAAGR